MFKKSVSRYHVNLKKQSLICNNSLWTPNELICPPDDKLQIVPKLTLLCHIHCGNFLADRICNTYQAKCRLKISGAAAECSYFLWKKDNKYMSTIQGEQVKKLLIN